MKLGSSPTTSETTSVRQVPRTRAASQPPLIAERCFRTVFSAWMSAPARSRRSVVARLSSSVMRSAGTAISAEAPPEMRTTRISSALTDEARSSALRPPASLDAVGNGCPPTMDSNPSGTSAAVALITSPARMRGPSRRAAALAIAGEALPAARTRT
jgi:hypothetical protein